MELKEIERRNIHTYPFKYTYTPAKEFFSPEKAAIYVHIPFCRKKCHFCDYIIYTNTTAELRENYVNAVCEEIKRFPSIPCFPSFQIDALYIGGGTPGLLEKNQLARILETSQQTFPFTENAEKCLEFDPSCVTREKLILLKEIGFNRLSLGIQSFDETLLSQNNRPHNVDDIYAAYEDIKAAGFTHINIDLLYPMFNQTLAHWEDSVKRAIDLKPAAITAYPLEIWPETVYHSKIKKGEEIPDVKTEISMTRHVLKHLEASGFRRRSTGGYYHPQRTSYYCRFGDYYWQTWPMLGFGVSAKSVIHNRLYTNIKPVKEYIKRINQNQDVLDFSTIMTREQEMRRVMIRGLKLCKVSKPEFKARFGVPMESVFAAEINTLKQAGWIEDKEDRIQLTQEGQVFDRSVYAVFYTQDDLRPPREGEVHYGLSDPLTTCQEHHHPEG
ncbi:MAG: radical SAM family heme chaperone HemW [Candidatus Aminicenantes bacterium]|jgi:oxygen-independent coproporphyrinogen-3 oxidase